MNIMRFDNFILVSHWFHIVFIFFSQLGARNPGTGAKLHIIFISLVTLFAYSFHILWKTRFPACPYRQSLQSVCTDQESFNNIRCWAAQIAAQVMQWLLAWRGSLGWFWESRALVVATRHAAGHPTQPTSSVMRQCMVEQHERSAIAYWAWASMGLLGWNY